MPLRDEITVSGLEGLAPRCLPASCGLHLSAFGLTRLGRRGQREAGSSARGGLRLTSRRGCRSARTAPSLLTNFALAIRPCAPDRMRPSVHSGWIPREQMPEAWAIPWRHPLGPEVPEDSVTPGFLPEVSQLLPADKVQVSGMDTCERHRGPRFRQVRLATRKLEIGAVRSGPVGQSSCHCGRRTERRFGVRWEPATRPHGA